MRYMYQGEGAEVLFIQRVIQDLAHRDRHGRMPREAMRPRLHHGRPETVREVRDYTRRRTYERWSRRLRIDEFGRCSECHRPARKYTGMGPMVRFRVWAAICDDRNNVWCDRCFRRRLGRPVCLHDLVVCLFNVERWKWLGGAPWTRHSGTLHAFHDLIPVQTWLHVKPRTVVAFFKFGNEVIDTFGGMAGALLVPVEHAAFKEQHLCEPVEDA